MKKTLTILVVDDNREYCELLCELFSQKPKVQVLKPVHNGIEAINIITSTHVDVMILDLVMPEMDGFGVLDKIRELQIPVTVIINSAVHVDSMTSRAMDLGAAYYFIKPTRLELIVRRVLQMMNMDDEETPESEALEIKPLETAWPAYESVKRQPSKTDKEQMVTALIREVAIAPHLRGYTYIRQAILLVIEDNELLRGITTRLYPAIAEQNNTTPTRVERAIRHAIEVAWNRGNIETHHKLFGYTIQERKGKPTNGEFIAMISDRVSMRLKSE